MAVYTQLELGEIEALVAPLGLGRLIAAHGVAAGVENTTYTLELVGDHGAKSVDKYVLTIAETLSRKDLEFVASLMHDLSVRNLSVPAPVFCGNRFTAHSAVLSIHEKPALLVPKIVGAHPQVITPHLCQQMGAVLAELHSATLTLGYSHESHRSLAWVTATANKLLPQLARTDRVFLERELKDLAEFVSTNKNLPQAIIHGDLFRDNVLIQDGRISAVIDFFSAGRGYLLFDLAIAANDWCFDEQGNLNANNYNELTKTYCMKRELSAQEIECWNQLLRIAALRFWVSRMNEQLIAGPHVPRGRGKDPAPYRRLVLRHRDAPLKLIYQSTESVTKNQPFL